METFTFWTWFWIFFPMPLLVIWAILSYVKENGGNKS